MSGATAALAARARARFEERFGAGPAPRTAIAHGRVNLIGEHTDYNDGFVLPMAIDRAAVVVFRSRSDRRLRAESVAFDERRESRLDALQPTGGHDWMSYVEGVAWAFRERGLELPGLDLVLDGNVPIGAGLSSSAALEMATARAFCEAAGIAWDAVAMARLGHEAENRYVGMRCGIMDQFASAAACEGSALLLDCRSLEARPVRLPPQLAVVVMDTGVRRALAGSAYNDRRAACERVVERLKSFDPSLRALRDASPVLLERARASLETADYRRARHVVRENTRPLELAAAFEAGDLVRAGQLMDGSHFSLRDFYQVSCDELDRITELAREHAGCFGARMTGAGFGGCAVALVRRDAVDAFRAEVLSRYQASFDLPAALYQCEPMPGARILD